MSKRDLQYWRKQLAAQSKAWQPFTERGDKIVKKYRDDDTRRSALVTRYNILYANTETLTPVLYSHTPIPDVRASDSKNRDVAVRQSAEVLETALSYNASDNFDSVMLAAVQDYLLPGMGTVRVKYEPTYEKREVKKRLEEGQAAPEGMGVGLDDDGAFFIAEEEEVIFEEVCYEYINWKDVVLGQGKCWEDITWIAFKGLMTREELDAQFGSNAADVKLTVKIEDNRRKGDAAEPMFAEVYEIWDKTKRKQIFMTDNKIIEENDDPLGLKDFFPIPKPLFAITTGETLIPVPFFAMYQDQALELDDISTRIRRLVKELKHRGVYDGNFKELEKLFNGGDDTFVPIKDMRDLQAKGGLANTFVAEDVTPVANVLMNLYQQREQVKQQIFEIMGISDIQRAQTDPIETASAQKLKAGFGKLRVSKLQREVQRFARDLIRLKAEVIAEKFDSITIAEIGGVKEVELPSGEVMSPAQVVDEIVQPIIKPQEPRQIAIDIETDSTIAPDEMANQTQAQELTNLMAELTQTAGVMTGTFGIEFTGEFLKSILGKFKLPKGLMEKLGDRIEEIVAQANQPQPPSPEELKMQLEQQKLEQEGQKALVAAQQKNQELELKAVELQVRAQEAGAKIDIEQQKVDLEGLKVAVESSLREEALEAEAANPDDNAIVGA